MYVDDAFGCLHRAHSSIVGVNTEYKAMGLLIENELNFFGRVLDNSEGNLTVILGGAKVHDKLPVINNLLDIANDIIIGGGMAFTFMKAIRKMEIGNSLLDVESLDLVKEMYKKA